MRLFLLCCAVLLAGPAWAEGLPRIAVFDFSLLDTSPAPPTPEELARLKQLSAQLRTELAAHYTVIDAAAQQAKLDVNSIRGCNGCELDVARALGAEQVAYGWVQKVSNLILNINVVVEDVASGHDLKAESVDIRSNTDESWGRGLRYLIKERMFRTD